MAPLRFLLPLLLFSSLGSPLHAQWRSAPIFEPATSQSQTVSQITSFGYQYFPSVPLIAADSAGESTSGFMTTFLAASAGSLIGLAIGAGAGEAVYRITDCCGGGDDPGMINLLLGFTIGSTAGSTLGAVWTGDEAWGPALLGSTIGLVVGALIGYTADQAGASGGSIALYSLGQGLTTASVTALFR